VVGPSFPGASPHGIVREERRRGFSLLLAPLLPWVVEWGTSANYAPQSLSRDFSQRALAFAGVKHGARSYSLHFSRASPPSPLLSSLLLSSLSFPRSSP
jgi:hypothetical protein